jgi:diguanylate cyclase (GGDEF)-like protein
MIFIIYIALFTFFRKKILFIESILNEYSHKAVTDTLTGLLNREGFEKEIKNKRCHTLLILDMDNFKYINDTFGHEIGDIVLKEFAWLLKENFKNDIIARWGGDEFLLCTDKTKNDIKKIIEKINDRLFQIQLQFDNKLIKRLSISVGGCADEKLDIQKRFNNADLALYKVKKSNKGKVLFFKEIDYIKIEKEDINK